MNAIKPMLYLKPCDGNVYKSLRASKIQSFELKIHSKAQPTWISITTNRLNHNTQKLDNNYFRSMKNLVNQQYFDV